MSTIEYANEAQTVRCNAYDTYTDTDNCIEDYYLKYYGKYMTYYDANEMLVFNDDAIVNVIPRNLFITPGIYSYVGKEYGFFIKTENVGGETLSTYMVFDIDVVEPYPQRSNDDPAPSVTVAPAITGTSEYVDDNVVAYPYSEGKLALANINVAVSVCNATEKNIGDTGYVASNDYGYAISSYAFEATGVGPKKNEDQAKAGFLKLLFGIISVADSVASCDVASTIVGTIGFISDCIDVNQRTTAKSLTKLNNTFTTNGVMIGNANTNSMIANYGNLVKGFSCQVLNSSQEEEEDFPLLYKTSAHRFYIEYGFCQKDADINWDALVATKVSVDIFEDNTKKGFLGLFTGSIDKLDGVSGGRIDSYNEIPSSSDGGTIEEDKAYRTVFAKDTSATTGAHTNESYSPANGTYRDFYFTPSRTYTYSIETFNWSPNAKSYIKLYDAQNNLIASDFNGEDEYKTKSYITATLTGGQRYRLRTMCHDYKAGAYDFIVRKHAILTEPTQTIITPTNLTLQNDTVWLSFIPKCDGYYTFTTTGTMDSYLTLYDDNYNKFTFDNDDGVNYNGLIEIYLVGGQTYYLNVRQYSFGSGQCSVYASKQYEIVYNEIVQPHFYFDVEYESPQFFRFTPTETKSYTFTLEKEMFGDPVMELYNSSWVLLTSDDDSADDFDPLITYTLQAGQTYYIKIRGYNGTDEYGYLYFE